ncbi:DDE-type integrase/transposase/recombinase [Streptomyces sp. NRRL F-5122]|uniref:DDE-type integrase/transposase/recombinase n=1 Tax=Streptomyces sp. NRRL F-5122 TaxID=1609098 RepID=UPI000D14E6A9|nr:DDE-type integrase/transposase/recombinase [Streptomyces sp. NRRL F-5122]
MKRGIRHVREFALLAALRRYRHSSRSRRVVGWSIDSSQTAALVTNALNMAISNRRPAAGTVIHSDHGVQFTSWVFTERTRASGMIPSMGTIGD